MEAPKNQITKTPSDSNILTPPTFGEPAGKGISEKEADEILKELTLDEKLFLLAALKEQADGQGQGTTEIAS